MECILFCQAFFNKINSQSKEGERKGRGEQYMRRAEPAVYEFASEIFGLHKLQLTE